MYYKKTNKIKTFTADRWFSVFTRLTDAYNNGYVSCITCGATKHWRDMQAGHFVTRGKWSTRFCEKNAHAQCPTCNGRNKGEQGKHALYIDKRYGSGAAQSIIDLSEMRGQKKPNKAELKDIAKFFRLKAKKIAYQKGIII